MPPPLQTNAKKMKMFPNAFCTIVQTSRNFTQSLDKVTSLSNKVLVSPVEAIKSQTEKDDLVVSSCTKQVHRVRPDTRDAK